MTGITTLRCAECGVQGKDSVEHSPECSRGNLAVIVGASDVPTVSDADTNGPVLTLESAVSRVRRFGLEQAPTEALADAIEIVCRAALTSRGLPWVCMFCGDGVPKGGRCKQPACVRELKRISDQWEVPTPKPKRGRE